MPPSKTQKWIFFFQVILSNKSFSVLSMISLIFTSQYYSYFSFELITYHIVEFWEHFQKSWYLFRHPKPWIVSENSSLSTKLPIYEKSTRSMKCPVYGKYYLWNVLSMNFFFYEMSNLWNILSLKCPVYDFVIYAMSIDEMSYLRFCYLWNVLSMIFQLSMECSFMKCPIYDFVIYEKCPSMKYPSMKCPSMKCLSMKCPIYDFVIYEMFIYEMPYLWFCYL